MQGTRFVRSRCVVMAIVFFVTLMGCADNKPQIVCTDKIGCVHIGPGEEIRIGVLQALSGKVAPLGNEQMRGIGLALDKREKMILGHRVVLQTEDTGCTKEGGANAALKIIADPKTVAIIGTTCSTAAAAASKAISDSGLTMISGNNSAPFLTTIGGRRAPNWKPGYFRTASNEETAGKAAAIYAYTKLAVRRAATINDGDIYTRGLTDGFDQEFEKLGGRIVLSTSVNKGDEEMGPVLAAVINTNAQLLFFPLFQPEGNHILLAAREKPEFEHIILMSDGALIESSFIEAVGDNGVGMYFVGPSRPKGPGVDTVSKAYKSRYNTLPGASYYLNAYDAADLLITAIEKCAVKKSDGGLYIGRQALRDTLYSIKDFDGVTGKLTCDEFGDCAFPIFNILRLDDPAGGIEGLLSNIMFTYRPEK